MRNAFIQWLSTNSHCFNHPPYNIQTGAHATISFNLTGITKALTWQVTSYCVMLIALWQSHCFENLLNWSNQHVTPNKILALFRTEGGSTWAKLITPAELESKLQKESECFYKVIPVLAAPDSETNL